jgi:D-amino-acid oxidase
MERVGAAVVGGGAVGTAVAWQLAEAGVPDVLLLERNPRLGEEQSGRSSGVVHAGIYYASGSLKARLCVEANGRLPELCRAHGVPFERTGKLVVAPAREDLPALEAVRERAAANGVPGLEMLGRAAVGALEPSLSVEAALLVPTTGIVDAPSLVAALARLAEGRGASVLTGFEVTAISPRGDAFELTGARGGRVETFEAGLVVNAAGLSCDVVGRMIAPSLDVEVVPLRGEYTRLSRRHRPGLWLSGRNVYPVPEPLDLACETMSIVGAHLTPTFALEADGSTAVGDSFTVGPEFRVAPGRDDYESNRFPVERFVERVGRYLPALEADDLSVDYAGIMVHLAGATDWVVRRDARQPNAVQLLGIDSPGLTCCVEIAREVRRLVAA